MWKKAFRAIFVIFGISFVRGEDGKDQQTFVVRYKNGDQTIPVTVVLDYKKQTEYVINMSPRTSAKSVTLYDFKQRTIAYKDLTNRECFLGRLTNETLSEENDALNRVQNPVNHRPKILSLDPQGTSLSPTEIRNVAGQKTAVFCRKMNTWLVLPPPSHSIRKRDVEDEEIDERTYHRHGYRTVRYSHYGHETRKRLRNPNQNGSRPLSPRNRFAQKIPKVAYSEIEANILPHHQQENVPPVSSSDVPLFGEPSSNTQPQQHVHHRTHHHRPKKDSIPELSFTHSSYEDNPTALPNSDLNHESRSSYVTESHRPFGHEHKHHHTHNLPKTDFIPDLSSSHSTNEDNPTTAIPNSVLNHESRFSHDTESHRPFDSDIGFIESNSNLLSSSSNERPVKEDSSLLRSNTNSSSINPLIQNKNPIEPSIYSPEILDDNAISRRHSEDEFESIHRSESQIESESNELSPLLPEDNVHPEIIIEQDFHRNGDASLGISGVPNITKKFQNLETEQTHVILPQTNEDVHDIFEGFYNLQGASYSPSEHNSLHNSYLNPLQSNHATEQSVPEASVTLSNPILSQNTFNNTSNSDFQRKENVYYFSEAQETGYTDSPTITTNFYDRNVPSTVYPTESVTHSPIIHTSHQKFGPRHFVQRYPNPRHEAPSRSVLVSDDDFHDENSVNAITTTSFPTVVQRYQELSQFDNANHRSDIPSESDDANEISETISPIEIEEHQYGPSVVPTTIVKEGTSVHHQRFQHILRHYKPDEIIIDIESLPSRPPPDSSLGFRRRTFTTIEPPVVTTASFIRREQTSETRRSNHSHSYWNPSGRRNPHSETHGRNNPPPETSRQNDPNLHRHFRKVNSLQQQPNAPSQFSNYFSHPRMGSLPPGVSSIHPRHPKAPYADMFHPNVLQPVYPRSNGLHGTPKHHHRQRHHRKKDRFNSLPVKDGKPASCCRNGGECCSPSVQTRGGERKFPFKTSSCCSGRNSHMRNPKSYSSHHGTSNTFPSRTGALPKIHFSRGIPNTFPSRTGTLPLQQRPSRRSTSLPVVQPSHHRARTVEDERSRCEKQKMCRTLYESTQPVMVCRNVEIEGC